MPSTLIDFEAFFRRPAHITPAPDIDFDQIHSGFCWHNHDTPAPQTRTALWTHFGITAGEFDAVETLSLTGSLTQWTLHAVHGGHSRSKPTYGLRSPEGKLLIIGQCTVQRDAFSIVTLACLLHRAVCTPDISPLPWQFACIQSHRPATLKVAAEGLLARLGQPYELWAVGMSACGGVLHSTLLNLIQPGKSRHQQPLLWMTSEFERPKALACPHHVVLFWRTFPDGGDAPISEDVEDTVQDREVVRVEVGRN